MKGWFAIILLLVSQFVWCQYITASQGVTLKATSDTSQVAHHAGNLSKCDTVPTVLFPEVTIVSFKTNEEWLEYYRTRARILKILPYVKIAKQVYVELKENEDTSSHREFRHYKKETEKLMRDRFENELKDLTTSEGKLLFKLINRETGNNCYKTIKELKGPFMAWFYQTVAHRFGYDLKENYDPKKERMIELIIKELGPAYNV